MVEPMITTYYVHYLDKPFVVDAYYDRRVDRERPRWRQTRKNNRDIDEQQRRYHQIKTVIA